MTSSIFITVKGWRAYLGNFVQCILHNDGDHSILHCLSDLSLVLTYKVNADWVSHWLGNVLSSGKESCKGHKQSPMLGTRDHFGSTMFVQYYNGSENFKDEYFSFTNKNKH